MRSPVVFLFLSQGAYLPGVFRQLAEEEAIIADPLSEVDDVVSGPGPAPGSCMSTSDTIRTWRNPGRWHDGWLSPGDLVGRDPDDGGLRLLGRVNSGTEAGADDAVDRDAAGVAGLVGC